MMVIGSGAIIFQTDSEVLLHVDGDDGFSLTLQITVQDVGDEPGVHFDPISDSVLRIGLTGMHNSPFGVGTVAPYLIGVVDGRPLLLAFRIASFGKDRAKELLYTIYSGDAGHSGDMGQ
tara:strand:+ start:163 stop:519 length:357 start_codon:yes stop_codon:yes gene_type:complete